MLTSLIARLRRFRSLSLLLGALVLGGLAALGTRNYIADQVAAERERLNPRREEVEVVVAKRDLRRGELVGPETMAVRRVPKEFLGGSVVRPERFDGYVGARLNTAMRGGEPLINQGIDGADTSSFSTKVRSGIRAMTIAVDEVNSISGMLQPGDRIDLQLSVRPPPRPNVGGQTNELTAPLMQDVLVLATGRQVRAANDESLSGRGYTTITVEVSPDQAQRLIVAQRGGRLTALLRNRDDRHAFAQRPLDINDLLGAAPKRRAVAGIEMIVGGRGPLRGPATQGGATGDPMAAAADASMLLGRLATAADRGPAGPVGAAVEASPQTIQASGPHAAALAAGVAMPQPGVALPAVAPAVDDLRPSGRPSTTRSPRLPAERSSP